MRAPQGVAEAECRRGLDEAEAIYMENLDETVSAEEEALSAMHQSALAKALEAFRAVAVGDAQVGLSCCGIHAQMKIGQVPVCTIIIHIVR